VSLHLHHDRAGLAAQAPLTLPSFSESSLPSSLPWPDSESENFCTHTGAGARVSVRACLPLAMYVSECPRALCGCSDTHTQTRPPDRPPVGFKLGCVGVETCAARGGTGGTFSAPTNMLRTAGCACEREQRSASDGTPVTGACLDTVPGGTVVCAHCPHRSVNKRQMSAETRAHRVVDERKGSLFHVPLPLLRRAGAWLLWSCNSESNNAKACTDGQRV